jgi:hypothetical protein
MMQSPIVPKLTMTKIADLRPQMKNVNVVFIVLEKGADLLHQLSAPPVTKVVTKEGSTVHQLLVADPTGCISASLFDQYGEFLVPGDIARIVSGFCAGPLSLTSQLLLPLQSLPHPLRGQRRTSRAHRRVCVSLRWLTRSAFKCRSLSSRT